MYWWNASKLAEDLREGRVDEKERFKYFLATVILWSLAAQLLFPIGSPFKIEYLIASAVNLAVIVIGTALCYRANKRGDNIDFVPRMICLGWPVGIWLAVGLSAMLLTFGLLYASPSAAWGPTAYWSKLKESETKMWTWLVESGTLCSALVFFYFPLVHQYLLRVAQPKDIENVPRAKQREWWQENPALIILSILGGIAIPVAIGCTTLLPKPLDSYMRLTGFLALMWLCFWMAPRWKRNAKTRHQ